MSPADFTGLALLFKNFGPIEHMATLHTETCTMLNIGKRRGKANVVRGERVADAVEDLTEREYPVKRCKCCK